MNNRKYILGIAAGKDPGYLTSEEMTFRPLRPNSRAESRHEPPTCTLGLIYKPVLALCKMSDQLLKVSGQVLQPIRNRVSSKNGAVQSASSCLGESPGAGKVFLTYSQSKARGINVRDIIKEELESQHMQRPCSPDSSQARLPLTLPQLYP